MSYFATCYTAAWDGALKQALGRLSHDHTRGQLPVVVQKYRAQSSKLQDKTSQKHFKNQTQ